jgi:hypothetical protein
MPRTSIPLAGGNAKVAEHNLYDFRAVLTTGNIWFVDSGASASGTGRSPEDPFTTLSAASAACSANNGDIIYVMEGHAETLDGAADVDLTVAGVRIIGLGNGASRPTFTFSTAADGTFAVGANSQHIENLLFVANFTNGVTVGVDIDGAHTDIYFKDCEWRASSSTKEFLKGVTIAEDAARVTFDGCRFTEVTGGDALSAIFTESTMTGLTVKNCTFYGDWSVAVLDLDDDAITLGLDIWNNVSYSADVAAGLFATVTSATVGFFVGNRSGIGKTNTVPVSDATASIFIDNLATDAAAISELKYPATPTAWA